MSDDDRFDEKAARLVAKHPYKGRHRDSVRAPTAVARATSISNVATKPPVNADPPPAVNEDCARTPPEPEYELDLATRARQASRTRKSKISSRSSRPVGDSRPGKVARASPAPVATHADLDADTRISYIDLQNGVRVKVVRFPMIPEAVMPPRVNTRGGPDPFRRPRTILGAVERIAIHPARAIPVRSLSWDTLGRHKASRTAARGKADCILGLDFGTAFTKACVRFRTDTVLAVDWSLAVDSEDPCLLPGALSEYRDGRCALGSDPKALRVHSDLKMRLIRLEPDFDRAPVVAFLALVTRYIRGWLAEQHAKLVGGFELIWSMNVGLPASSWDDKFRYNEYRGIAMAAWNLGSTDRDVTLQSAQEALDRTQFDEPQSCGLQWAALENIPEFVAQIAGYVRSARRRGDLHTLVDVGAGTVDIVTFNVHRDRSAEQDVFPILDSAVQLLGTHVFLAHRAAVAGVVRQWEESDAAMDSRTFAHQFDADSAALADLDSRFASAVGEPIGDALINTRVRRYPNSPSWKEGIPVLLCGGGRSQYAYQLALNRAFNTWPKIDIRLPVPEELRKPGMTEGRYHRLSVAYGLCYSADDLGKIQAREDVRDVPLTRRESGYWDNFVSKDQV